VFVCHHPVPAHISYFVSGTFFNAAAEETPALDKTRYGK
jgi:hypothetical protein